MVVAEMGSPPILKKKKLKSLFLKKKVKSPTKLLCSNPIILPDCLAAIPIKIVKGYKKIVSKVIKTYVKIIKKPVLPPPP